MYLKVESENDAVNLSNLLKDGNWMVLYWAEWCGHCNAMKPEWHTVVNNLKKSKNINIADIESTHIPELPHKPQIPGYPTINIYINGKRKSTFNSDRTAAEIEKFAMNNTKAINTRRNRNNRTRNTQARNTAKLINTVKQAIRNASRKRTVKNIAANINLGNLGTGTGNGNGNQGTKQNNRTKELPMINLGNISGPGDVNTEIQSESSAPVNLTVKDLIGELPMGNNPISGQTGEAGMESGIDTESSRCDKYNNLDECRNNGCWYDTKTTKCIPKLKKKAKRN